MKKLIVTADDVGLDRGMTRGAIEAHRNGIVTACSIVANGREFDDAVARLKDVPSLEIGVHLTLVEEKSLTTGEAMPKNWMRFLVSRFGDIEGELRLQIERVLVSGLRVTHLNGHQHLHQLPRVARIVRRLADEYGIRYVRVVNDRGGRARRLPVAVLNSLGDRSRRTIGVAEAGHLTANRVIELLDHVDGVTEFVTHPGIGVSGYQHWHYEWDAEAQALCDPAVRKAVAEKNIELIGPSTL
ncbi:MAG TPA: ChbG/HpnK family deacetylase [Thermoanaerobaculia bacterium]|nr:ChbG/HpnK family deacetylase [Thermoanaerobaculia bacterium]